MKERENFLLPFHIGGEMPSEEAAKKEELTPREKYELRQEKLMEAPDLDGLLRKDLKEKGIEPPETLNLSLLAIEEFQRITKEAQTLRKVAREAKDPQEKMAALGQYDVKKQEIQEYLNYGFSFEKAYREYIMERNEYITFTFNLKKIRQLESALEEPAFKSIPETAKMDDRDYSRLEKIMRESKGVDPKTKKGNESLLESLKSIFPEDSQEYKELAKRILEKEEESEKLPRTKKEIREELNRLMAEVKEKWENPMVRYFWQRNRLESLLEAFARGDDVIETESVIKYLNELHEWEKQHQRTTVGGILVGPPGVGKTTLIEHYLKTKNRSYAYIDASEELTWYFLWGSKEIEFTSRLDYLEKLEKSLSSLDEKNFKEFIVNNAERLSKEYRFLKKSEAEKNALAMIFSEIMSAEEETGKEEKIKALKEKLHSIAVKSLGDEIVKETLKLLDNGKNGWRDGIILSALRKNESLIIDEFNHLKKWTNVYKILTSKPGSEYYFKPTNERIRIPDDWRMYFTANIGRKHGGFEIAEALASRAGGKVMEINYPPVKEEMEVALASLSDPEGNFLRSKDDLVKLFLLVNEAFPKIRTFIEDKRQSIPISFRTIRDLGEKLVLYRHPETKKPVYRATEKSFDEAIYDILVKSYALYEDKTIPENTVKLMTSIGLLLDEKIKDDVIKWIGKETYAERKAIFEKPENKKEFDEIVKKIRGMKSDVTKIPLPEQKNF